MGGGHLHCSEQVQEEGKGANIFGKYHFQASMIKTQFTDQGTFMS